MIKCIYIKKTSLITNAHHDVTDFKFHEILRNKAACLKGATWLFNEIKNFLTWTWKRTFWEHIICPMYKIQNLEILEKFFFTSNFERSCNFDAKTEKKLPRQKLKRQGMLWLENVKISEVSKFSILFYTQNRKLTNLGKCCFTSNLDSSCNLRWKNNKKLTETKT